MHKAAFTLTSALLLQGCASSLGTFYNRPVVEDRIPGYLSTFSLSADRRTVIIPTYGDNAGKFCAEPPPDSATQLKSELQASLEAKAKLEKIKADIEGKGTYGDKLETSVVVLAERTPALDAFRTGVYALCQYRMNGWLNDAQVNDVFLRLIESFDTNQKSQKPEVTANGQATRTGQGAASGGKNVFVLPKGSEVVELAR